MPFVSNEGVRVYYETEDSGPAIVLHPGSGGDSRMWRDAGYAAGLAGYQKVLIDPRGRGKSDRPTSVLDHTIEHYADDVRVVLDEAGIAACGFWGYSMGMYVGLAFATAYPRRLRAMVGTGKIRPIDVTDLPPIDPAKTMSETVAAGGVSAVVDAFQQEEHDRFPPAIDASVRETDPLMFALDRVAIRRWKGPKSALQVLRAPSLFIAGEREDPERETDRAAALAADARVHWVAGVGHLSAFYRSELVLPTARAFWGEHLR